MKKIILFAIISLFLLTNSCKKKDKKTEEPTPDTSTTLQIKFESMWDSSSFVLNQFYVQSKTQDSLKFTMFKYYVSNIQLQKSDSSWWVQPDSYFLIDAEVENSENIIIKNIPVGDYVKIKYTLGIDSLHNVSGDKKGALAEDRNMFWDWTMGYIMLKAEGYSPNAAGNSFSFHLGGYKGAYNIVTTNTSNFNNQILPINAGKTTKLHFEANVSNLWDNNVSVNTKNVLHMGGASALSMAKPFFSNIKYEHMHL